MEENKDNDFELYKKFNFSSFDFNLDTPIYKYIPYKYVKRMIDKKKLYFGKVERWEDVFENWLIKSIKKRRSNIELFDMPKAFGQCWTFVEESDAMWRIYSNIEKHKEGADDKFDYSSIRVRTTPRKILKQILNSNKNKETVFIGPVKYLEQRKFEEIRTEILKLYKSDPSKAFFNSYFIKRTPFEHEKEVRVVVFSNTNSNSVEYDIDLDYLFDEFVIDPRIQRSSFYDLWKQLVKLGVSSQKIRQSELYQWNPFPLIKNLKRPKTKEELQEIIIRRIILDGDDCNLNDLDLSQITDLSDLFANDCGGLLSGFNGVISGWNVSRVKNMSGMFSGSSFDGDISRWDVGNVEDMSWMFQNSRFQGRIDCWDVKNVSDIQGIFNDNNDFFIDLFAWKECHFNPNTIEEDDEEELIDEKTLDKIAELKFEQRLCNMTEEAEKEAEANFENLDLWMKEFGIS